MIIICIVHPVTDGRLAGMVLDWRLLGLLLHPLSERLRSVLLACQARHIERSKKTVYRVVLRDAWATKEHLISGVRAEEKGGRWNPKGQGVHTCYTSEFQKTAVAEHLHYARLFAGTEIIKTGGRIFPDDFWESRVMGIVNLDLECVDLTQSPVLRRPAEDK